METYDKDQLYKRQVNLYIESNPNPNAMKFVANFMMFNDGESYDFADQNAASASPLASALFEFSFVDRVFFMSNFITITKKDGFAWEEIGNELKSFIKDYLEAEKPFFEDADTKTETKKEEESETVTRIKEILEEYIKPAVEQDGGAIIFDSYDKGIVKVLLQGSCSGCPSSILTLKAGIENLLKSMLPEIQAVEAESV